MKHTLYRKLEADELIKEGDVYASSFKEVSLSVIGMPYVPSSAYTILRPVSTETVSGSTEDLEEDFGGGARSMHADIHEMQRLKLLREQYAGLAMQGLLSYQAEGSFYSAHLPHEGVLVALEWADALIAALNKKEEAV